MEYHSRVMDAARGLVRYAACKALKSGDRLPPQSVISAETRFCNNVLTPAVNLLTQSGFLEGKGPSGRFIRDPRAWPDALWRIAVPYAGPTAGRGDIFGAVFFAALLDNLQQNHCGILPLHRITNRDVHTLNDFRELAAYVAAGRLDGMTTTAKFSASALKKLAFPVVIPQTRYPWESMFDALSERGVRQPLVLAHSFSPHNPSLSAGRQTAQQLAAERGMQFAENAYRTLSGVAPENFADAAGRDFADFDGYLVLDDTVALPLTIALAQMGKRPPLAVCANRQFATPFALPVIAFELDIYQAASQTVNHLLEAVVLQGRPAESCFTYQRKDEP